MPEPKKGPIQFSDAAHVKQVMNRMAEQFADSTSLAGMGVLASFATAIAKLADEIEKLKDQEQSP
jgi:hypothetical protein